MNKEIRRIPTPKNDDPAPRHILHSAHIGMLEEALSAVGEYGEVRLVVEKGRLRFIIIEKSYDVLKWSLGST
jgi:hypothetical protein